MDQIWSRDDFRRDALPEPPVRCGPWTLSRLEIRTRADGRAWPLARVDVEHDVRGRITDIAVASGGLEAVFKALRQIVGLAAAIDTLSLDYQPAARLAPGEPWGV